MENQQEIFIRTLFAGVHPMSKIEIRLIKDGEIPKRAFFFPIHRDYLLNYIARHNGQYNVYFGIYPRTGNKGDDSAVKEATCIYADIDVVKDHNGDWKGCVERINEFQLKPSMWVKSGNGMHIYWIFNRPVAITPDSSVIIKGAIAGVAKTIGGDTNVVRLCHPFRVPGTFNVKDPANPKLCELKIVNDYRCALDDFKPWIISLEEPKKINYHSSAVQVKDGEIQKVLNELQIVSIRGEEVQAYCPFHQENSPSFYFNTRTGQWYCFSTSCEKPTGGGVKTFWRKVQDINIEKMNKKIRR